MKRTDPSRNDPAQGQNGYWPDSLFRTALVVWLVLGLTSILKGMLSGEPSVGNVLLVAWGVVVIFVLWFRMGPPGDSSKGRQVLR